MKDTVTVPRWVAHSLSRQRFAFTSEAVSALDELLAASERETPWDLVRALIAELVDEDQPARTLAQLDQMQQYATNRLDQLQVDVRDSRVLYEVLCVLGLVAESARNGRDNGAVSVEAAREMQSVCRVIGAALGQYVPEEARR